MTESLWTAIKYVAISFEPQWMFRRRVTNAIEDNARDSLLSMCFDIKASDFVGKELNNIKEWNRLVRAHRELIESMMSLGAVANERDQQESMGKWIAGVIRSGNRAADIMDMLYPDQKDAPWRKE